MNFFVKESSFVIKLSKYEAKFNIGSLLSRRGDLKICLSACHGVYVAACSLNSVLNSRNVIT